MANITFPDFGDNLNTRQKGERMVNFALKQMRVGFTNDDRKVLFGATLKETISSEEDAIELIEQFFTIV